MFDEKARFRRDLRIDFLRGLALITIFVDHVPNNRWAAVTQQNFGFSDAAELFVALAGYSAVLAYGRYFDADQFSIGLRRVLNRIGVIYVYHLATLLVVAVILLTFTRALGDTAVIELFRFDTLLSGETTELVGAALLVAQPTYFDILPLYVVLLALFPLLYVLLRRNMKLGLALSAVPWVVVQFVPLNLPTTTGDGWHFNPLAWQFLLALGIAAAIKARRGEMRRSLPLVAAAVAVLIISLVLRAPWTRWPLFIGVEPVSLAPYGALMAKTTLGPARLIHIMAFGYLLMVILQPRMAWLKSGIARVLSDAGRNSLDVFCVGVVLSVLSGAIISVTGQGALVESGLTSVGVGLLLLIGIDIARRVRASKRRPKQGTKFMQAEAAG